MPHPPLEKAIDAAAPHYSLLAQLGPLARTSTIQDVIVYAIYCFLIRPRVIDSDCVISKTLSICATVGP